MTATTMPAETPAATPAATPKQKQPDPETIIATLVDYPRFTLKLIKYEWGADRHFVLRRMKFMATENVKGTEIKIEEAAARVLVQALQRALDAPRLALTADEVRSDLRPNDLRPDDGSQAAKNGDEDGPQLVGSGG